MSKARASGFFYGGSAASWSSVNKCTEVGGSLACAGNNCIESLIARDSNQPNSSNNIDLNGMSESLTYYTPGEWVFFQRSRESGGGYWLGRTYDFVFMIELPQPVSLHQGILFLNSLEPKSAFKPESPDDFKLQ